ncbi:hypothetical protein QBC46DRAFT_406061 [Diplogelasinospora grovesii]|uniref:Uncharacterized protein n=1 Tax=Diplogelasinospora grovesii TaxID=303347 RepID=A0AAN6S6C3_9PEZI|nr:hypothetical protein QBC46DRAFT_406061 [Diplogelasinospora grovesii]
MPAVCSIRSKSEQMRLLLRELCAPVFSAGVCRPQIFDALMPKVTQLAQSDHWSTITVPTGSVQCSDPRSSGYRIDNRYLSLYKSQSHRALGDIQETGSAKDKIERSIRPMCDVEDMVEKLDTAPSSHTKTTSKPSAVPHFYVAYPATLVSREAAVVRWSLTASTVPRHRLLSRRRARSRLPRRTVPVGVWVGDSVKRGEPQTALWMQQLGFFIPEWLDLVDMKDDNIEQLHWQLPNTEVNVDARNLQAL